MTQEEKKQKALEYLKRRKMNHMETSYGFDCQIYEHRYDVVDIKDAETAIKIALGELKWE